MLLFVFGLQAQTLRTYIESGVLDLNKPPYSNHYADTLNVLMQEYKHVNDTAFVKAAVLYAKTIDWRLKDYSPYIDFYREVVEYEGFDTQKPISNSEQWSGKSIAFEWLLLKNTACKRLMDFNLAQGRFNEALHVATLLRKYFLPAWCGNYYWEQSAEYNDYMTHCYAGLENIDSVLHYSKNALQNLATYIGKDGFQREDKLGSTKLYPYKPAFYKFILDFLSKKFSEATLAESVENAYNDIQCELHDVAKIKQCHTVFMNQAFKLHNDGLAQEGRYDELDTHTARYRERFKEGYLYMYFSKQ
jgi:hypothetical protein